jgi:hypothetical protein
LSLAMSSCSSLAQTGNRRQDRGPVSVFSKVQHKCARAHQQTLSRKLRRGRKRQMRCLVDDRDGVRCDASSRGAGKERRLGQLSHVLRIVFGRFGQRFYPAFPALSGPCLACTRTAGAALRVPPTWHDVPAQPLAYQGTAHARWSRTQCLAIRAPSPSQAAAPGQSRAHKARRER